MPMMNTDTTLRIEPHGALEAVLANEGDPVEALGTQEIETPLGKESWTKVQLLGVEALPSGWVPTANVDFGPSTPESLDIHDIARQCWWVFLLYGANPYYMLAVAQLRSGLFNDVDETGVGLFRFSQAEWNLGRINPKFGLGTYREKDISDWRMQCIMFGLSSLDAGDALGGLLGRQPSWVELYLAQMIGAKAASEAIGNAQATLDNAFSQLKPMELPPGGLTVDQILSRYQICLRGPEPAARTLTGSEAVAQIAQLLKESVEAVQEAVDDVSAEFLGAASDNAPTPDVPDPNKAITPKPKAQQKIPGPLPSGGPPLVSGAGGVLGELIAAHEGGRAGYGAFNRGIAGDSEGKSIDFSKLTIQNVMDMQSLPRGDPKKLFAVGKYQLIPATMAGAVRALKIKPAALMSPSLQELLFRGYLVGIKRPEVSEFIMSGDNTKLRAAQIALANEFASVGLPDTGLSRWAGTGGNKASITPEATVNALVKEHLSFAQNVKNGMNPDDAWMALSPGIA
jgi:hypothetical protein